MQTNKITSSSFGNRSGFVTKTIRNKLKNKSTAVIRMGVNENGQLSHINYCEFDKNNELVNGVGIGAGGKSTLHLSTILKFLQELQKNADEGVNFLRDFVNVISK